MMSHIIFKYLLDPSSGVHPTAHPTPTGRYDITFITTHALFVSLKVEFN